MTEKIVLVDGSYYLHRAYHATPSLISAAGQPTGAVYGVISMLRNLLSTLNPSHFAVVFDAPGKTFRHDKYPDYKSNRPPLPLELISQIDILFSFVKAFGFPLIQIPSVEADDVLATLAYSAQDEGLDVVIASGDKDLTQLVQPRISILDTMRNHYMDTAFVQKKFGVTPQQIPDFLALAGDSSDNIPGVPGVGPKTASTWISQYGNLENLKKHAPKIKGKVGERLRTSLANLDLYLFLTTVRTDIEIGTKTTQLTIGEQDTILLTELCQTYNFNSWLKELAGNPNLEKDAGQIPLRTSCLILDLPLLKEWVQAARLAGAMSVAIAADVQLPAATRAGSLTRKKPPIAGIAIALKGLGSAYIPLFHNHKDVPKQLFFNDVLRELSKVLTDKDVCKIGHNLKELQKLLMQYEPSLAMQGELHDVMLQSYLLNPQTNNGDFPMLMRSHLAKGKLPQDLTADEAKVMGSTPASRQSLADSCRYYAAEARISEDLQQDLALKMQEGGRKLCSLYSDIEMPLSAVLASMENKGILLDTDLLNGLSARLGADIVQKSTSIYQAAGCKFNIDSPIQVQEILYEKRGLPVLKKTPKGKPSTDENSLRDLSKFADPLPQMILDHRFCRKLKSTYTDKLPRMVDAQSGRLHTTYQQALTLTGRLSSVNPNLQNIPIRRAEGRQIRNAFIAEKGCCLISADYSQIEMRVMAYLSQDERLMEIFRNKGDIHTETSAEVFAVPAAEITPEQRRTAKATNFGLIYGMSAFGLAKQLDISLPSAKVYVEKFFQKFPGVAAYMQRTQQQANEYGFVETIYGRKIYLPDLYSRHRALRGNAQRAAINCPVQGSAADIIKIAMVKFHQWLQKNKVPASLILQVHDELVVEASMDCAPQVQEQCCKIMQSVGGFPVPLEVQANRGPNWGAAHS